MCVEVLNAFIIYHSSIVLSNLHLLSHTLITFPASLPYLVTKQPLPLLTWIYYFHKKGNPFDVLFCLFYYQMPIDHFSKINNTHLLLLPMSEIVVAVCPQVTQPPPFKISHLYKCYVESKIVPIFLNLNLQRNLVRATSTQRLYNVYTTLRWHCAFWSEFIFSSCFNWIFFVLSPLSSKQRN